MLRGAVIDGRSDRRYIAAMPAPHKLAKLHSLGGDYAEEAVRQLRHVLGKHRTVKAAALELGVHEKTVFRWMLAWGVRKST